MYTLFKMQSKFSRTSYKNTLSAGTEDRIPFQSGGKMEYIPGWTKYIARYGGGSIICVSDDGRAVAVYANKQLDELFTFPEPLHPTAVFTIGFRDWPSGNSPNGSGSSGGSEQWSAIVIIGNSADGRSPDDQLLILPENPALRTKERVVRYSGKCDPLHAPCTRNAYGALSRFQSIQCIEHFEGYPLFERVGALEYVPLESQDEARRELHYKGGVWTRKHHALLMENLTNLYIEATMRRGKQSDSPIESNLAVCSLA